MAEPTQTIIDTRGAQMFPALTLAELKRLKRFGVPRHFSAGEFLARAGETGHGLVLILAGEVEISQRVEGGGKAAIVVHKAGSFMGELAQLSGRPSLVDAEALSDGEAVEIPPERLRALLIAEAELGERIMRALILRRVGLIETGGGGPVIVGHDADADVLRLVNFLSRNGHPYQRLDPDSDPAARALIERFRVEPEELPIVLCPGGQLLQQSAGECAGALHRPGRADRSGPPVRRGRDRRRAGRARHLGLCGIGRALRARARLPGVRRPGGRVGEDRELSRLPDRHFGHGA